MKAKINQSQNDFEIVNEEKQQFLSDVKEAVMKIVREKYGHYTSVRDRPREEIEKLIDQVQDQLIAQQSEQEKRIEELVQKKIEKLVGVDAFVFCAIKLVDC